MAINVEGIDPQQFKRAYMATRGINPPMPRPLLINPGHRIKEVILMHDSQTAQRLAEESLQKIEEKAHAWLEYSPVCTKIVDLDFNLQYMSSSGVKDQ